MLLLRLPIWLVCRDWHNPRHRRYSRLVNCPLHNTYLHGSRASQGHCNASYTRTFADTIQVAQMYTNLAIDFGVGLVPVVGDLADAWFKCNTRNNLLLEKFLRERGATNPAPPPPPKQSTVRRWFGPGPDAPGSHPGHQVAATETPSQNTVGNNGNKSAAPVPPPRNTMGPKLSGRGVGTDGGKDVVDARERDLEAQIHHGGQDSIRYTRED